MCATSQDTHVLNAVFLLHTSAALIDKHLRDPQTQEEHIQSDETCSKKDAYSSGDLRLQASKQNAMCSCLNFMLSACFYLAYQYLEQDINRQSSSMT